MLSTLAQKNFALLWFGGLISYLGNWAMFTALALFIYEGTRSALASSTVLTLMVAPLLLTTFAGALVDRWDRRRTLVAANLTMGLLTLPLLISERTLWLTYLSVLGVAAAGLVVGPAENALLPRLVGHDRLTSANALNSLNDNLGRIVGSALGGALYAMGGFSTVVLVNAASYVLAAVFIYLVRPARTVTEPPTATSPPPSTSTLWHEWLAGLRTIIGSHTTRTVFLVTGVAFLGDALLSALLAPFVAQTLSSSGAVLGMFLTIRGIGGLLGGMVVTQAVRRLSPMRTIGWSTLAIGVVLAGMVAVPRVPVALGGAALLGVLVVCWLACQRTVLHRSVPESQLGRVFGALGTLGAITVMVGSVLAGAVADVVGVWPLLLGAAGLYATAGLLALRATAGIDVPHEPLTPRPSSEEARNSVT